MSTQSNARQKASSRFYTLGGEPVYEIPKKSGKGMKKPNITDAIENGWVPSVTTVLKSLNKPNLNDWIVNQAVKAVMDTPRLPGESNDDFVYRVLEVERIQDDYADKAAQLGTDIHEAIELAVSGQVWSTAYQDYVGPVLVELRKFGKRVWSEKVLVGEGYAGRSDYLGDDDKTLTLVDFKSTSKLPEKAPYDEHLMQVSAYAKTLGNTADRHQHVAIIYISTTEPGRIVTHVREDWQRDYEAFIHLLKVWQYVNGVKI